MSTFSKVLHIGEETVTVVGNDGAVSLGMSRQSVRLSYEEADELVEALMHGRTRSDGFTAADMMDARAEGFRGGQRVASEAAERIVLTSGQPAPARGNVTTPEIDRAMYAMGFTGTPGTGRFG